MSFTSPDGLSGLRAIVSGLHFALGIVILVFCLNRLYLLGVFVSACAASGLAIVRLFGMVTDNAFTRSQVRDLIPELLGLFIAIAIVTHLRTELRLLGRASAEARKSGLSPNDEVPRRIGASFTAKSIPNPSNIELGLM